MSRQSGLVAGAGWKLAAEATGRLLQFGLAYFAQIRLGPRDYGLLVYAVAAGLVIGQLADGGVQLSVTREMVHDERSAGNVARTGIRLKCRLAAGALLLITLVAWTRPNGRRLATWAAAASIVAAGFVEYAGFAFRGLHRVTDDARLALALRIATAAAGGLALWAAPDLTTFAVTQLLTTAVIAIAAIAWLRRELPALTTSGPVRPDAALFKRAWPLGIAVFLSLLYTRTPTFLLDAMAGAQAVGIFGVAQRLVDPSSLLPAAILASVFPAVVGAGGQDHVRARLLRARTGWLLAAMGAAIAVLGISCGPWIIRTLYRGQYAGAERPFQILCASILFTFSNYALTHFLIAFERQRTLVRINAAVLAACVVLCCILIPRFGPSGASIAIVCCEAGLLIACLATLQHTRRAVLEVATPSTSGPLL